MSSYQADSITSLQHALAEIKEWEKDQSDLWFWEKIGRIPFAILDKLTPKIIQKYIGIALDELGSYIQTGGQYLIAQDKIMQQYTPYLDQKPSKEITIEQIADVPLSVMNQVAEQNKAHHTNFATAQGATTGFGGVFTLAIDIPMVLGTSLKVLQEMAITYGYDPKIKEERIFVVKCMQFSSSDFVGKQAILKELTEMSTEHEAISKLQGWREVILSYRDNYGWKKLFQLVPILGMLVGAVINRYTIQDVAEAGKMLYQKRRALAKLQALEKQEKQIEDTTDAPSSSEEQRDETI